MFLVQIYCLLLFDLIVKNEKKMFCCVYKGFDVMCISVFDVVYKLRLVGLTEQNNKCNARAHGSDGNNFAE